MSANLASNIKRLLDESRLSVMGLEKKAGLKTNAVRNILSGHTKKPSAETVLAISRALGCSLSQIIEDDREHQSALEEMGFENVALFKSTVLYFLDFYEKNALIATNTVFIESIHHIYKYLSDNNKGQFDERFADWFLSRQLPL